VALDLFTCGDISLIPFVPTIKDLFGIPKQRPEAGEEDVYMEWAHKQRGFRRKENRNPEDIDLNAWLLGWKEFDMKTIIATVETSFQTIDVVDVINPRFRKLKQYEHSLAGDASYESSHPDLFRPDRVVYLDKIMQSRYYGEAAYHEALVHPAMFAHENPRRVAIIGGGEGATLREILKHNTVETVTMVEIDKDMVDVSRKYLPEWSNCGFILNSTASCFDDPRTEVFYTDAVSWFVEKFVNETQVDGRYDVIIMDAL
jgi:spermidine synthase